MWMTLCLVSLVWVSTNQAVEFCEHVFNKCNQSDVSWTRCYDDEIRKCKSKSRGMSIHRLVNSSQEAEESPTQEHKVHVPSSALKRCSKAGPQEEVVLVCTVLSSTYFKLSPTPRKESRLYISPPIHRQNTVLGGSVLVVKAGDLSVRNLPQPIILTFKHNKQVENGACVFWEESKLMDGTGFWSTEGCDTIDNGTAYICHCNHLSFFAVLVNPIQSVDKRNAMYLSYITYIGSALSVFFTAISLIIYICLQRQRPEKAVGVHMQLTGALFCLHLSFLLCKFWVWQLNEDDEGWVCRILGLFLHWSLLATISWTALEGFHLYLLLVRVFNVYVRRYLLKLSLVGWGLPTLIAVVCGISGVYGKYNLKLIDTNNRTSTEQICWMSSQFPQKLLVSYVTTVAFLCLVILYNSCMLGLVVYKLWVLRGGVGGSKDGGGWNKMNRENRSRLWKDCVTVLGLSCMLGLPLGLASTTYISLTGMYIFTIFNSLQGVFVFLWSVALTCKPRSDNKSSGRDSSSQKMMTTSFNN